MKDLRVLGLAARQAVENYHVGSFTKSLPDSGEVVMIGFARWGGLLDEEAGRAEHAYRLIESAWRMPRPRDVAG